MRICAGLFFGAAAVVSAAFVSAATGHAAADGFVPHRYPFLPELFVNERPEVCARALEEVRSRYLGTALDVNLFSEDASAEPEDGWLGFEQPSTETLVIKTDDETLPLSALRRDLDGDGEEEILVRFFWDRSYYRFHSLYRSPSAFVQGESEEPPTGYVADGGFISELGQAGSILLESTSPFILFVHDGELLAYQRRSYSSRSWPNQIVKLRPESGDEVVCAIRLLPESEYEEIKTWGAPDGYLSTLPKMAAFVEQVSKVMGERGHCGGSRAYHWKVGEFRQEIWTLLYRPWAALAHEPNGLAEVQQALQLWSNSGLWQRRTYRQLGTALKQATAELAEWYEKKFGVDSDRAGRAAENASLRLTSAIMAGSVYTPGAYLETIDDFDPQSVELRLRLLDGAPARVIEGLLAQSPRTGSLKNSWGQVSEPALFFALEHPDLVKLLLDHGVDVDETNSFGKTALMYAAQFNLPGTARILLEAGADPNLRTSDVKHPVSCFRFIWISRTALMYAAENADEAMMALLIDSGADPTAVDTPTGRGRGEDRDRVRGIADYLERNETLAAARKAAIIERWSLSR